MIRKDYETGGFPISKTCPIICFVEEGEILAAYDNTVLRSIMTNNKVVKCVGVWPGKMNTDCFILSKEHYGKISPPGGYENIDYAKDIALLYKGESFVAVSYKAETGDSSSISKELADYILKTGIRHRVIQI